MSFAPSLKKKHEWIEKMLDRKEILEQILCGNLTR